MNTTTEAVLPSTIANSFMEECIASQPILKDISTQQHAALVDLFRNFCDQAVAKQRNPTPAPKAHAKAPPVISLPPGSVAGSSDLQGAATKRNVADADGDADLEEGVVMPPLPKTPQELTAQEKAAMKDHEEAQKHMDQQRGNQ